MSSRLGCWHVVVRVLRARPRTTISITIGLYWLVFAYWIALPSTASCSLDRSSGITLIVGLIFGSAVVGALGGVCRSPRATVVGETLLLGVPLLVLWNSFARGTALYYQWSLGGFMWRTLPACSAAIGIDVAMHRVVALSVFRDTEQSQKCRCCEYDLTGNSSGVCPECGTPIPMRVPQCSSSIDLGNEN